MSAFWEVVLVIWIDFNVLFVLWRILRAVAQGEIVVAPLELRA
jgi:hypothetical protein